MELPTSSNPSANEQISVPINTIQITFEIKNSSSPSSPADASNKIIKSKRDVQSPEEFSTVCSSGSIDTNLEQTFAVADSNSGANSSKTSVPCKVCGDKASGYHYGVTSCEGCKGFFRRSIQKQIEYRCLRDGKCVVIRLNRNRCQFCRFKKCLVVGMSRDSVRYGRVPKRSRDVNGIDDQTNIVRVNTPNTPGTPSTPQMCSIAASPTDLNNGNIASEPESSGSPELSVYDTIICVSQAHRSNCTYTEEQTKNLNKKPLPLSVSEIKTEECEVQSTISEPTDQQRIYLWQQFANRITPGVQRVVEFAKRVPGFCDFSQDDQLILIKLGFFEVWVTHIARTTVDTSLTFDDGIYFTREQLEIMYDNDFVVALLNFTNGLNGFVLSDTEIGLFSALVLLASDRSGLTEPKVILRTRERIAEALRVQIVRSRPGSSNSMQIMPALEAKIPELKELGKKHLSHLDWLRTNWTLMRLPPLFSEIFDIPKCEEDLQ